MFIEQWHEVFETLCVLFDFILVHSLLCLIPYLVKHLLPFLGVLSYQMTDLPFELLADFVLKKLLLFRSILLLELINNNILEILILLDQLIPEYLLVKLNNVGILFKFLVLANLWKLKVDILWVFIVSIF